METQMPKWCPVIGLFNFLSKRWTFLIMRSLGDGATTFSDIKRKTGAISSRILSERLEELQMEGFVNREVIAEKPIKIRYSLTEKGASFHDCIDYLDGWVRGWEGKTEEA